MNQNPNNQAENTNIQEQEMISTNLVWQDFVNSVKVTSKINPAAAAEAEMRMYLEEPIINRKSDPLLWWKNREILYPTLSRLAKKYLCVVATSVPSKRVFSKAGQIITERRNRLKTTHLEKNNFSQLQRFYFEIRQAERLSVLFIV